METCYSYIIVILQLELIYKKLVDIDLILISWEVYYDNRHDVLTRVFEIFTLNPHRLLVQHCLIGEIEWHIAHFLGESNVKMSF